MDALIATGCGCLGLLIGGVAALYVVRSEQLILGTFARRLAHVDNIPQQDRASNAFNKLARTFAVQLEAPSGRQFCGRPMAPGLPWRGGFHRPRSSALSRRSAATEGQLLRGAVIDHCTTSPGDARLIRKLARRPAEPYDCSQRRSRSRS